MEIEVLSIKALAHRLGVTHDYVRQVLVRVHRGELSEWKGYRFFGLPGKAWFAYKADQARIRLVDETGG